MAAKRKAETLSPEEPAEQGVETLSQKQFVEQVVETYRGKRSRFCFILGAGASVESEIPTGTELEMRWMNCLMGEAEDPPAPKKDREETRKRAKALFAGKKLQHPFEEIQQAWDNARQAKKPMPSEFYFDIYSLRFSIERNSGYWYLEKIMEGKRPSVGYHTLALFLTKTDRHNLVITTNFDNLVEDALFLYTDERPMVVGHESLADYIDPNSSRPIVAKVHRGLFYEPINKPGDCLDPRWEDALHNFFSNYTPIVIGYGGGDNSLMSFLSDDNTRMRHGLYWCCRNGDDPGEKVRSLVGKKQGYLVSIQGFDALMLELGTALFPEDIPPSATEQFFSKQSKLRMQDYGKQWDRWMEKNIKENPEIVSSMETTELEDVNNREKKGTMSAWDYLRRGQRYVDRGDYPAAIEDYTKSIELDPKNAVAYSNRGHAFGCLKEYTKAIDDCSQAILLEPDFAEAYNNRGYAHSCLGSHDSAIADFNKAIALKPKLANPHRHLGNVYTAAGDPQNALEELTTAIFLQDEYPEAYRDRAQVYRMLGKAKLAARDEAKAAELEAQKQGRSAPSQPPDSP